MNIGIILAAGNSTRFNNVNNLDKITKQLFIINNKTVLEYSIECFINIVDKVIIIVNDNIKKEVENIQENKIIKLINNKMNSVSAQNSKLNLNDLINRVNSIYNK